MTREARDLVCNINRAMLLRHERRLIKGDSQAQLIGEHLSASRIQSRNSQVEKRDILAALDQFKATDTHLHETDVPEHICGTPIRTQRTRANSR